MPKLEINQVAETIKRHDVEPATLRAIIEDLNLQAQPEPDEEKVPAVKKQFSIVISDPNGTLPSGEYTGWVLQIPEDASVTSTLERIHKAAYEFNTTKKGRMMPAKTVADAIENIPAKHFKEQQVWVKTKVPVFMLTTDNEIPREPAQDDGGFDRSSRIDNMSVTIRTGETAVRIDGDGIHPLVAKAAAPLEITPENTVVTE